MKILHLFSLPRALSLVLAFFAVSALRAQSGSDGIRPGVELSSKAAAEGAEDDAAPPGGPAPERSSEPQLGLALPGGAFVQAGSNDGEIVRVGADARVKAGESIRELVVVWGAAEMDGEVHGDMVVVWGDATMNGKVHGDMITVFGKARVNGEVEGSFVNVFGGTTLGPHARLRSDCVVVDGKLDQHATAVIAKPPVQVNLHGLGTWLTHGLLLGRPIVPSLWWVWVIVLLHFVLYLLVAVVAPKPVEACVQTLEGKMFPVIGVGLVGTVLAAPFLAIVGATGVGLVLVPFIILAWLGASVLGKTAVLQYLGLVIQRRFNPGVSERSLAAFLIGFAVVTVIYMVPFLGFLVLSVLPILGLGTAALTGIQALRRNSGPTPQMAGLMPMSVPMTPEGMSPASAAGVPVSLAADYAVPPALSAPAPAVIEADFSGYPRAGFWLRLAATFLDLILLGWVMSFANGLFVFPWLAYHIGMWMWKGTTIGGIVCNLKVVRLDGRPMDFTVALVRGLAAVFSFMALGLGFFWAGWSPDKQSWHDKIAGTVIVKVPRSLSLI